ncbi:helicase HerA-like domain-containing protein [Phycicoccus elongatus]|uniref:helicase HerA-like domain-containing protein n=1 Tax=Phycicoccus elongatus TaxID=101689 RepID=UPI0003A48194|nr:helicase HerA-like domain-containing protein [Phycicoccus elongatus]
MTETPGQASPALPPQIAEIAAGYAFNGPALEFGAAVLDNTAYKDAKVKIPLAVMNRHGLVAGATGTGKTKTLQLMAEQLVEQGVPVFLADIKGDLSGMASPGVANDKITARANDIGEEWLPTAYATEFYSLGGQGKGIPIRASVSMFGPTLLSKCLGLNDTQESSLGLVFHYADSKGLWLDTIEDLRAVISFLTSEEGKADLKDLGGLSSATAGVILRELVNFSAQGADAFFGLPEYDTSDLLRTAPDGRGLVSMLELPAVQDRPQLFSTFLMWLLADLFHDLPEVGDLDKPKLVFFFDEAHLLFNDASKDFLNQIQQTVRLIRSKGIGIFFVTQSPKDVPADVLAQLGNRVQHALRAFTPDDAKALRDAIRTYPNTAYDMEKLLTSLGIGEAVITVLSERGAPTPVAWTRMRAPESLMAPSPDALLDQAVVASPLAAKYATAVERESALEMLGKQAQARTAEEKAAQVEAENAKVRAAAAAAAEKERLAAEKQAAKDAAAAQKAAERDRVAAEKKAASEPGMVESVVKSSAFKSMLRSAGTVLGREITRSIFGTSRRR